MSAPLSQGSIKAMYQSENCQSPIVQVIDIKKIQGPSTAPQPERYRLVISDGIHYQQAMLATQLNNLVKDSLIANNCVIKLKEFICNTVHNRRIVIVLNVEVICSLPTSIGNPANIEQVMASPSQYPPQQQHQQQVPMNQHQQPPMNQPQQSFQQNNQYKGPQAYQQKPQQNFQQKPQQNQQQQQQPYRQGGNQFGVPQNSQQTQPNASGEPSTIYPIKSLNPYQNRWTIKARVTAKSDIRTWTNARGSGKLFNIDLLDSTGGEIRATMFNDAADHFFPLFEVNKVYYISKGTLKIANKKFSSIHNEYELSLDINSFVQLSNETDEIPLMHFNFIPISAVNDCPANEIVDVIGVVTTTGDCVLITTKAKKETKKRNITIVDSSCNSIELSLWGDKAENLTWGPQEHPVIAVKGAKVSTYNGKTLGSVNSTIIEVNPDHPEAFKLRSWFDKEGQMQPVNSLTQQSKSGGDYSVTEKKTFSQIKEEAIGNNGKPLFCEVKAMVTMIRQEGNIWYQGCPDCGKKVVQTNNNLWYCEGCKSEKAAPTPRYVLSMSAADLTGSQWLSSFNDIGALILGVGAPQMEQWRDMGDPRFQAAFYDALHKQYRFKIRAQEETYQDQPKLKCTIMQAKPINFVSESAELIQQIQNLSM